MQTTERYLTDAEIDSQYSGYTIKAITTKKNPGIVFQGKQLPDYYSGDILLEKDGEELFDNWIQHRRGDKLYIAFDNWFAPLEYDKLSEAINLAIAKI